jgi:hypothetical protein
MWSVEIRYSFFFRDNKTLFVVVDAGMEIVSELLFGTIVLGIKGGSGRHVAFFLFTCFAISQQCGHGVLWQKHAFRSRRSLCASPASGLEGQSSVKMVKSACVGAKKAYSGVRSMRLCVPSSLDPLVSKIERHAILYMIGLADDRCCVNATFFFFRNYLTCI